MKQEKRIGLISDELLGHIKAEISIVTLVESAGVTLKRQGSNHTGLCPFHDDREPSLVVTPAKNLWHCLGACQAGGSVIDWVMRAEGFGFREAVDRLIARYFPGNVTDTSAYRLEWDRRALLDRVVSFYHEC